MFGLEVSAVPVLFCVFSLVAIGYLYAQRRNSRLPPGPKGIPFVGNIFDIPKTYEWKRYREWSRQYNSDLIHLNLMGTPMVILHTVQAANDLFEKRSALYSDRQSGVMANDLIGWDFLMGFMRYGTRWRDSRRAFHQHFTAHAVTAYYPTVEKGSRKLLVRLLEDPENFLPHIRHMTGELIMRLVYGIDVLPKDDPYISITETALQSLISGNAGAYLVKHIPAWFPGAGFKRLALAWRKDVRKMVDMPYNAVRQSLAKGEAIPSMLSQQLSKLEGNRDNAYEESVFRSAAASAYTGGADTTVSSLGTFILAMLFHPEVQKRAQAELDRVVGQDRLPTFDDEQSLPYISAIVKEVLRAMLHDESKYPQPEQFQPERYLNSDGTIDPRAPDPSEAAFGFGRRICPGRHLARASVWMTVACTLATFDIEKTVDKSGRIVEPRIDYTPGLISYPVPFKCAFKVRSEKAEKLIQFASDEH
ncbi:hypothetical protein NM688_g3784 [Phlebia brevispora]|uniref:Uncharacterized protein n=1 Tax=Phlebia brevispora TaxID=194682 RepID=A0ACC1T4J6_9APHY|nr:hypothetical protein NM688_g3784 [Phlebia brevispora]